LRTRLGRFSRKGLILVLAIAATIVIGMILPGHTGTVVEVAGWIALAIFLILEIGIRTTPTPNDFRGNDRRPW
jgi:hypothetical protein